MSTPCPPSVVTAAAAAAVKLLSAASALQGSPFYLAPETVRTPGLYTTGVDGLFYSSKLMCSRHQHWLQLHKLRLRTASHTHPFWHVPVSHLLRCYESNSSLCLLPAASDLWAVGCILFECASGRPPFAASTTQQLNALILEAHPQLPPGAPVLAAYSKAGSCPFAPRSCGMLSVLRNSRLM